MCFSATASFTAAGVLATTGVVSLALARKSPAKLLYASIPLLFGIQQLFEGLQWQSIRSGGWNSNFAYAFLFFAFIIWPVLIPLAVTAVEKNDYCKNITQFFGALGTGISLYLIACLVTYPLTVTVAGHSLSYNVFIPFELTVGILYITTVCGSLIFSSRPKIRLFGYAVLASAVASILLWSFAFTSVWCFFSAILSLLVIFEINSHVSTPTRNKKPLQKLRPTGRSR